MKSKMLIPCRVIDYSKYCFVYEHIEYVQQAIKTTLVFVSRS